MLYSIYGKCYYENSMLKSAVDSVIPGLDFTTALVLFSADSLLYMLRDTIFEYRVDWNEACLFCWELRLSLTFIWTYRKICCPWNYLYYIGKGIELLQVANLSWFISRSSKASSNPTLTIIFIYIYIYSIKYLYSYDFKCKLRC